MGESAQIRVGIVGAGFLAETRARCWKQVVSASVGGVVSRRREHAVDYARRFDVPAVFDDLDAMLANPAIDVVDLCVPNRLHREMTEAAAAAGKHVICTKPLTAYTGQDLPEDASDADVAGRERREMLRVAEADARAMVEAAKRAGVQLLYGETGSTLRPSAGRSGCWRRRTRFSSRCGAASVTAAPTLPTRGCGGTPAAAP